MTKGKIAVLSDFDGTIVNVDTGVLILERFAKEDWQAYDVKLEREEISVEECLTSQFGMIKVSKEEILAMLSREPIQVRPNFRELIGFCKSNDFPFTIVTGGIDFCVESVLRSGGFGNGTLNIHCGKSEASEEGLKIIFPERFKVDSLNFKQDLVNHLHDLEYNVVYIGDGNSDYEAARKADLVFSIKGSSLSKMCEKKNILHIDFLDFIEVISGIKSWNRLMPGKTNLLA